MQSFAAPTCRPESQSSQERQAGFKQLLNAAIFIVDDEPTTMEVVQAHLETAGYFNFVLIEDSREAMAALEQQRPDLLLLDLHMPQVTGFDLLKEIRIHPKLKQLPVIILTASSDKADKLLALDIGATDFLAKPVDSSELRLRVRNTLAAKAYADNLAYYDPLTRLPNRHLFMEYLERDLTSARLNGEKLALLSIELDQFDKINDTMGLLTGDEILQQLTRRLRTAVQESAITGYRQIDDDIPVNLFHLGGGVFTMLLHHISRERDAALMAKQLLNAIRERLIMEGTEIYLTASIGISTYPTEKVNGHCMLQLSSSARDYVKNAGGNAFQFSSQRIHTQYRKRLSLEARLRKAVARDELILYYQPQMDIKTNRIIGVEALVRWQVNSTTMVPPAMFIPIAEETGLINPIGQWVLNQACQQLSAWQQAGIAPVRMAVNLSPAQFQIQDLVTTFNRIIDNSGISPDLLTLEVTESMLLEDLDSNIKTMHRLKDIGIKLAIDDFGTGYSSLSYLTKLPLDELKIDRSFVAHLIEEDKNQALIATLIYLSRRLKLYTLAEGVETKAQLAFLRKAGCNRYQGHLCSPPVPPHKLSMLLSPSG